MKTTGSFGFILGLIGAKKPDSVRSSRGNSPRMLQS